MVPSDRAEETVTITAFSQSTQRCLGGRIVLFPSWTKKRSSTDADVDAPPKCSLALRKQLRHDCVLLNSRPQEPSWTSTHDPADTERLPDEQRSRMHRIHNFQLGGPEKLTRVDHPRHALQENAQQTSGTLMMVTSYVAQCWYCPTCKHLTQPTLILESETNSKQKSSTTSDLDTAPPDWKINEVRPLASVDTGITDQLLANADVIRAMNARKYVST